MPEDELKQWKAKDRLRRKAARQRESRKERKALMESLEEQLAILTKAIEQKSRAEEVLSNVVKEIPGVKKCVGIPEHVSAQSEHLAYATPDPSFSNSYSTGDSSKVANASTGVKEYVDANMHWPAKSREVRIQDDEGLFNLDRRSNLDHLVMFDSNALIRGPLTCYRDEYFLHVANAMAQVNVCVEIPKHVSAQNLASDTLDPLIPDNEALIEFDANALISEPLIQSQDIENAILSDSCPSSLHDDISIPFDRVFDMDVMSSIDG